jgi:hypothetical protein
LVARLLKDDQLILNTIVASRTYVSWAQTWHAVCTATAARAQPGAFGLTVSYQQT